MFWRKGVGSQSVTFVFLIFMKFSLFTFYFRECQSTSFGCDKWQIKWFIISSLRFLFFIFYFSGQNSQNWSIEKQSSMHHPFHKSISVLTRISILLLFSLKMFPTNSKILYFTKIAQNLKRTIIKNNTYLDMQTRFRITHSLHHILRWWLTSNRRAYEHRPATQNVKYQIKG